MTDQKKMNIDNKIILLINEAMKSGVSKEEFSLFIKRKALKK
ncbi:anti-repressor SinI family protein [Metabacillus halosaccharovorans]|nr:anti-repressor SinI family protein [Metabacillus halosaccharovorans]